MRLFRSYAVLLALALAPIVASAQLATPKPGEYIMEGGWGTLVVRAGSEGGVDFKIDTLGANAHSCQLEGTVHSGIANVPTDGEDGQCHIAFISASDGVQVAPLTLEECRYFCGMRAGFSGVYLKPNPRCEDAARENTRHLFKAQYDARDYREAQRTLEPLLSVCAKTLFWIEEGEIRNDLAITQYHLHDYHACLVTLKQYAGAAGKKRGEDLPPADADMYSSIYEPAQHNIALCERAARQR